MLIFGLFKKKPQYGVVRDKDGNPVKGVSVGLRDVEFDRIVGKRITDGEGKYRFVVNKGEYQLEILEANYEVLSIEEKEDKVLSDGSLLIARDIVVKPIEVEK
ncbi:MAG: transmembrane(s)protein, partial [candidate division WS6 bacterium 34_10]